MTTSTKKQQQQFYGEYINPTIDQYSSLQKENPLVLMAQACNNIEKEYSLLPSTSFLSKQRKSNSPPERKKSLKRIVPTSCLSPPTKKTSISQSSSSSSFTSDSLFYHQLNQNFSSPTFDVSLLSSLNSLGFSPLIPNSSYLMDSILSSPFVCNWFNSTISNDFCGKRFNNHNHLLEHLCTDHSSMKSLYPSYYSST